MDSTDRRTFLMQVGELGLAASAGVVAGSTPGCGTSQGLLEAGRSLATTAKWPVPYSKLDVEIVRKRGHANFYKGDCCYGAFNAIVESLAEQVGEPFTSFPSDMMRYGKGGVYGYGTLCGALNGAAAAVQLVTDEETAAQVITELLNWYATTELPTETANQYAVNHEYLVDELKTDEALPQNVAGNVLCHISVSKWSTVSGFASGSEERKERCARLAGDVAAKAVELLNAVRDETFAPALTSLGEQAGCMACHKPGLDFSGGNFTQGKMDCTSCHVDPVFPPATVPAHGL
jgi:Putative redox-active protein (C_GCAxxG_C_C)